MKQTLHTTSNNKTSNGVGGTRAAADADATQHRHKHGPTYDAVARVAMLLVVMQHG